MRAPTLLAALLLASCDPSEPVDEPDAVPPVEQPEPSMAHAPENSSVRFVQAPASWDFALEVVPSDATSVYVQIEACAPRGYSPGTVRASTTSDAHPVDFSAPSCEQGRASERVWMATSAPHVLTAEVRESTLGAGSGLSVTVRVLGWFR